MQNAEEVRMKQTRQMQLQIRQYYKDLHKDVLRQIQQSGDKMTRTQLTLLKRDIEQKIKKIDEQIRLGIIDSMETTAREVVQDTREFLIACGFSEDLVNNAFSYVPQNVIQNIITGQIYQEGWSLSEAIWGHTQNFNDVLSKIVANGLAQGKSAYEVAKDLEKYVNPSLSKPSREIEFINPNTGRKDIFYFGDVDYNAQRLARTLISHAYQQSFMHVNEYDPFVKEYIWHSAGIHGRTCQLCLDRDGEHFPKDALPLDHPNGLCTFEAYIPYSMTQIADKVADWYNSPTGTYPDIDLYVEKFFI